MGLLARVLIIYIDSPLTKCETLQHNKTENNGNASTIIAKSVGTEL